MENIQLVIALISLVTAILQLATAITAYKTYKKNSDK
jgi:hypothetical protein